MSACVTLLHPLWPEQITRRRWLRFPPFDLPGGVSSSTSSKGPSFLLRVFRAALPVQLLPISLACLVPMTEEDYSCHHANNFTRSFHPMLHYTNGPLPI
ncbi:nesprin-1 isoform X1 [Lates japonicus]|uniref:Nesprin-1 isoform X1 n=1 Tax=Lates japonicus TaxID=270547 RepID=A0AAD3M902_LATJO|nr:nesprin-1 isoform X1 [Lates japonicus]